MLYTYIIILYMLYIAARQAARPLNEKQNMDPGAKDGPKDGEPARRPSHL